jgi:hypothetical protein
MLALVGAPAPPNPTVIEYDCAVTVILVAGVWSLGVGAIVLK